MSSTASTTSTARPSHRSAIPHHPVQLEDTSRRIPVTPAVLRSIFASSRSPHEERSISRVAFFRFAGFLLSVIGISLAAARNRGLRGSAALLGVV
ncbi:hypothetical protein FA15DRAFT_622660 [Coprinopsis marcescibilis]|uniref:Uncharacterized protein n=1 Tax=Coprinopsis marcescibilis TaxID=230819 RepID=A0A5C3KPQ1_COPMA|nr:hypothetical protein FA15DRAFT_622660 [Coprinopsis marcescibilis]